MRKFILHLIIFNLICSVNYAQEQKIISDDSLLKMFRAMKPFEVLEKVDNINFKALYADTIIKPYLMKWLNEDDYFQHNVKEQKIELSKNRSFINSEIKYRLKKQNHINELNTVLNSPTLYASYKDTVIIENISYYIKNYHKETNAFPNKAIEFIHF